MLLRSLSHSLHGTFRFPKQSSLRSFSAYTALFSKNNKPPSSSDTETADASKFTTIHDEVTLDHFPKAHRVRDRALIQQALDISRADTIQLLRRYIGGHQKPTVFDKLSKENVKRKAAILIPLCQIQYQDETTQPPEPAILFTVRSLKLRSHGGEVSFPGGLYDEAQDFRPTSKMDPLEFTALRETVEELPSLRDRVGIIGKYRPILDKTMTIEVHPFVGVIHGGPLVVTQRRTMQLLDIQFSESEVSAVFVLPFTWLLDPSRMGTQYFRGSANLAVPTWTGPVNTCLKEFETASEEQMKRYKRQNVIERDGEDFHRVWGLSAYVLARLIKQTIIPLLVDHQRSQRKHHLD